MISQELINRILKIPLDQGLQFAEIYGEKSQTNSISLEENKIEKVRSGIDAGTGIRIIHKNISYYGFANSFAEADLLQLVRELSSAAKIKTKPVKINLGQLKKYAAQIQEFPLNTPAQNKINLLVRANNIARKFDPRIIQVSVGYADSTKDVLIANTKGVFTQEQRVRTRLVTEVVAKQKELMETGYESAAATQGLELFAKETPETIAITAAKRAILCLEADHAPAGKMPVVLAGEAGGTMVHEACGHALEADFIYKKTSIFKDKLDQKVVSDLVTVVDDGTIPGLYGTNQFDDEGTITKKNILIENGILKGFMSDLISTQHLKIAPSGNGRRQSYRYAPIPRMTNTYIQAGKDKYADILSSVKSGVLVKKMGGGQVDITNGNFVFEISEGYLIKNGRQDQPIRGATLVGNGIDVLASVDMVGDDLHFIPGTCGKGQAAPVSDGQPTLRIPELTIGGHA